VENGANLSTGHLKDLSAGMVLEISVPTRRERVIALAARYAVPTMYVEREFASAGGLISYGTDLPEVYRLTGGYAGRILGGDKPADLPVLLPTKFEMIINLRTAKALGLDVPDKLLALADEVIE
jgi:putative tryptophan/tyrosine transport system substrate-binding protein